MNVKTTQIILGRLRSFLTSKTTLLALLLVFAFAAHAQYGPNDDFDGDGIINSLDLDDDNDGILDTIENAGSVPLLSGFQVLYSANGTSSLPTGSKAIVRNALTFAGISYHAIVEVTGTGGLGGGSVIVTSGNNLALKDVTPVNNPYFTYSLKFVSSVGFVDANYQNTNPVIGATIPKVTVILADIDGSSNYAEVSGYKSDPNITQPPIVGSELVYVTNAMSPIFGGFQWGTNGQGGPGATAYNYYRPLDATATDGGDAVGANDQTNWITVTYDSFTVGEYVFGNSGKGTSLRGEGGPSMFMGNIDFTDIDGDGIDNSFDLDSDNDGCSDSNEAYGNATLADAGKQYGMNTFPVGTVAPINPGIPPTPFDPAGVPSNGRVVAAEPYPTTTALYKPAITKTEVVAPVDVSLAQGVTNATFSTSATGTSGSETYVWQQKLFGASTWTNITNGTVGGVTYSVSSFNPTVLNISNITQALHNSDYRAVMSDPVYLVCGPLTSDAGNLKLAVPPNPLPIAVDNDYVVDEDKIVTLTPLTGDSDPANEPLTIVSIGGTNLTPGVAQSIVVTNGTVNITAAGVITFTPALHYFNTPTTRVVFPYVITDGTSNVSANQNIEVRPVNDAPVAGADSVTVQEDVLFTSTVSLLANDTDIDLDPLTAVAGTFTTAKGGTLVLAANGSYTYLSALNFNGTDTVNYTVTDGKSPVVGILTITVDPVNDAPVANNDIASTAKDTDVIIAVASNDTDIDGTIDVTTIDFDPLTAGIQATFTVIGEGTYTANANGTVTFNPEVNFDGIATPVNYVIQDNQGGVSNVATITVTVNADSDGDGVLDATEIIDGTDPLDPCSSIPANATLPKTADFSVCEIEILTSFSPNGDGSNEEFKIRNIEKYPNNTLQIYDRWGVVVYEANGYGQGDKLFRGQSQGRSTISASGQLPVGTYFYALKYVDASGNGKERAGYLYINR